MNPKFVKLQMKYLVIADKVRLIEPLEVFDFHNFMNKAYIILTDSGGVQEEAPSLGKPVLVLRDTTERPEGIEAGTLKLVGTDEEVIYEETKRLLTEEDVYMKMSEAHNPYGDGFASKRIVDEIILRNFNCLNKDLVKQFKIIHFLLLSSYNSYGNSYLHNLTKQKNAIIYKKRNAHYSSQFNLLRRWDKIQFMLSAIR